jgi:hypothetical protein
MRDRTRSWPPCIRTRRPASGPGPCVGRRQGEPPCQWGCGQPCELPGWNTVVPVSGGGDASAALTVCWVHLADARWVGWHTLPGAPGPP